MWAPRGAVLAGIQTDSVLSARLQIIRIYIREDGRLVIEFKTQAKFRGEGGDPGRDTNRVTHSSALSPLCAELHTVPPATSLSSPRAVCHGAPHPARCQVLFDDSRAPGRD